LVEGYKAYITTLGITTTAHPLFISIAKFGSTGFNYGYNNYQTVVTYYQNYLLSPTTLVMDAND
jgi:hypothetical protein